jgi:hypothetical protein
MFPCGMCLAITADMKRACTLACLLMLLPTLLAAQARVSAEPWFNRSLMLSAEVGGAAFSDFQRAVARPAHDAPLEADHMGDFNRRVSAQTTTTLGASVSWWIGHGWGIRSAASYSPTRFSVWNEQSAARALEERNSGVPTYAKLHSWTADATAVFRFPFTMGRVVPYGLAGGGMVGWRLADEEELPPEARVPFASGSWSGPAVVYGVGGAIPMQRYDLMLNFELTSHLSRTPLDDSGLGERFHIGDVPLDLAADPGRGSDGIATTHQFRLVVGITLPIRL